MCRAGDVGRPPGGAGNIMKLSTNFNGMRRYQGLGMSDLVDTCRAVGMTNEQIVSAVRNHLSNPSTQDHPSELAQILTEMFKQDKPTTYRLRGGLALAYKPGESFRIGRMDKYPSATEIKVIIREAAAAGVKLHQNPSLGRVDTGTAVWCVANWKLEAVSL